ncbi:hypothetical protein C8R43DRAFT_1119703 [Mycena crocata]|nr:hypothetical protein C8R43DRAFT_1119703 [Mycena crocata]
MTALTQPSNDSNDSSAEYDDEEFLSLMANVDLSDHETFSDHETPVAHPRTPVHARPQPRTPRPPVHGRSQPSTVSLQARRPPRTPSPPLYVEVLPSSLPTISRRTPTQTAYIRPIIYGYENSTTSGRTSNWSTAGSATQGVPGGRVHIIQTPSPKKKRGHSKKAAYVIYCGINTGVRLQQTEPLVRGVPNCIFRGYATVREAVAAFDYAVERGWTRNVGDDIQAPIPVLPQPTAHIPDDTNPLNGSEDLDDTWFVVYPGITPGVYRSHLECQLNTLGVRGALHESIAGREEPSLSIGRQRDLVKKRQELKSRPIEEQRMAAARARAYQATYRQKHRSELRKWEAQRRMVVYQNRHGLEAAKAYLRAKRERKRQARAKLRAKDGHFDVDVGANDATDVRS